MGPSILSRLPPLDLAQLMGLVGSRKEAKGKCSSVMSGDSLALAASVNHLALGVLIVCENSTSDDEANEYNCQSDWLVYLLLSQVIGRPSGNRYVGHLRAFESSTMHLGRPLK